MDLNKSNKVVFFRRNKKNYKQYTSVASRVSAPSDSQMINKLGNDGSQSQLIFVSRDLRPSLALDINSSDEIYDK